MIVVDHLIAGTADVDHQTFVIAPTGMIGLLHVTDLAGEIARGIVAIRTRGRDPEMPARRWTVRRIARSLPIVLEMPLRRSRRRKKLLMKSLRLLMTIHGKKFVTDVLSLAVLTVVTVVLLMMNRLGMFYQYFTQYDS